MSIVWVIAKKIFIHFIVKHDFFWICVNECAWTWLVSQLNFEVLRGGHSILQGNSNLLCTEVAGGISGGKCTWGTKESKCNPYWHLKVLAYRKSTVNGVFQDFVLGRTMSHVSQTVNSSVHDDGIRLSQEIPQILRANDW